MKNKLFFFTTISIIFFGCATKKTHIEYKDRIVKDSIFITKDKIIIEKVIDSIIIKEACDSLGVLKPFKRTLIVPQGRINLYSNKGNIHGEIDLKGYENIVERKYNLMYEKKVSEITDKTVKYKYPLWLIIYSVLITLICGLLIRYK